jgi:hypothetical protein
METKRPNPEVVRAAIYEVVDNQLRDGEPPETRQTLERLMAEGHSQVKALQLIAAVVSSEIFEVLKHKRPYDQAGYVAALQRLPKLPWDH